MEFEVKDISPTKKTVSFKFLKEEVEKEKDEIVKKFKKNAVLPGFRPGKVPPEIIKARFKKEIEEEILDTLTGKNIEEIIKEKNWKIVGDILFTGREYEEEFFKFEVQFFIIPEIEPPSLEGIELKKEEISVEEKEIDEEIESIRSSKVKVEDAEGPVEENSYVLCHLKGRCENEEKEIDFGFKYLFPSGKDPVLELLGKNKKDEVHFSKDIPPDDPSPLRGKKINYVGTIEEIKVIKYPELNIEFIKENYPNINTVEEFRELIKRNIYEIKKSEVRARLENELINQLLAKTEIPVPEPLLEEEIKTHIQNLANAFYQVDYNVNEIDWERTAKEYEPEAIKKVQRDLLLLSFAKKYGGIEVADEEVLSYLRKQCEINNLDYEKTIKEYRKSGKFEYVRKKLITNKVMDKIFEDLGLQI